MVHVFENFSSDFTEAISVRLGISLINNLEKYLGIPMIHGKVSSNTYEHILDKVRNRIMGWKAKCLLLAGRSGNSYQIYHICNSYLFNASSGIVQENM